MHSNDGGCSISEVIMSIAIGLILLCISIVAIIHGYTWWGCTGFMWSVGFIVLASAGYIEVLS